MISSESRRHRLVTLNDRNPGERRASYRKFLEEASRLPAESLDYEATLRRLARLVVPEAADVCTVTVVDEDGSLRRVAASSADPNTPLDPAGAGAGVLPPNVEAAFGIRDAIRTGRPHVIGDICDEAFVAAAHDPGHLEEIRSVGARSCLVVPLVARERTLGALSFVMTDSGRRYSVDDLTWVDRLAPHAALAIDNARMYRRMEEAVRVRDDFFSIASHEMLTPVTTLRVQVQSLERALRKCHVQAPEGIDLEAKFRTTLRQVDRLTKLVDRLLDASRIAGGTLRLEREDVDLVEIVHDVVARFESDSASAGCELRARVSPGGPIVGHWDPLRIDEVLSNLVTNAIRYAPGKPIDIAAGRVSGSAGELARIVVRDEGQGIAPEDHERIFRRFERASPESARRGLGLGLFIARSFVEAHGGAIRVESAPGAGAEFVVDLPLTPPPQFASIPPPPP